MGSPVITGVFNDGYIADVYDAYRRDTTSVDESWRQFFRFAESLARGGPAADPNVLRKVAGAASLADAIRAYGHLGVSIDPLRAPSPGAPDLTPDFHGVSEQDLAVIPGAALGLAAGTAADGVAHLRMLYSSTMGFEFEHVGSATERSWLRNAVESGAYHQPLRPDEQQEILRRLTEVDALERFLGRAYQGYKRFSIEGSDVLVVLLDELIRLAARAGAHTVAIGMAHRGRINVLAHILGMPYRAIFEEFEGKPASNGAADTTGDVKYHLGHEETREVDGVRIGLTLVPNPSHLEFVNPVLEGVARAKQRVTDGGTPGVRNETAVVPVCIHGDAAFPGEGVVAETLNLSLLRGYRTGGTVHIIVNNQVGFTTDPVDSRSTHYASDLAKGFDIPVVHVNGDDPQSCLQALRLSMAYRRAFGKDVLIDLVSYRRHGHNETDEPAFTQPVLYQNIRTHRTPREIWGARLVQAGILSEDAVRALDRDIIATLERIQGEVKAAVGDAAAHRPRGRGRGRDKGEEKAPPAGPVDTTVPAERLVSLNEQLLQWPTGFTANTRVARTLARRRDAMGEQGGIDWGHAEALAFASLLTEGTSVRLTGQDVERGTFSHRHDVLHDAKTGVVHVPLQHLTGAAGVFEIFNSPLSETAVLGFEYGYSVGARDALVLWEAQYGDFANVAQAVIDQFIASGRVKWGQESGVTLLLPHGYEGGGPEHSSARLERYLQLCAEDNLRVAYPSTPAQYFHVLRRQAKAPSRRPLVLMQPKSLLRLPEAASTLHDLATGAFRSVIDDPVAAQRDRVKRIVFCTGKMYYDLLTARRDDVAEVALVRVEELYPWPHDEVARVVDSYPAIDDVVWVQEEPKNMGACGYVSPRLRVSTGNAIIMRYVGRPERASPAEGYATDHTAEQQRIVTEAFTLPQPAQSGRVKTAAR